jgi:hypothetical protein
MAFRVSIGMRKVDFLAEILAKVASPMDVKGRRSHRTPPELAELVSHDVKIGEVASDAVGLTCPSDLRYFLSSEFTSTFACERSVILHVLSPRNSSWDGPKNVIENNRNK